MLIFTYFLIIQEFKRYLEINCHYLPNWHVNANFCQWYIAIRSWKALYISRQMLNIELKSTLLCTLSHNCLFSVVLRKCTVLKIYPQNKKFIQRWVRWLPSVSELYSHFMIVSDFRESPVLSKSDFNTVSVSVCSSQPIVCSTAHGA